MQGAVKTQGAFVGANDFSVGGDPLVPGLYHTPVLARLNLIELAVDGLAKALELGPKILAIDIPVGKPEGTMMGMIVCLARCRLHRIVTRHGCFPGADERVTEGARNVLEIVLGEEPSIDFNAQPVGELGDLHPLVGDGRGRRGGHQGAAEGQGGQDQSIFIMRHRMGPRLHLFRTTNGAR